MSNQHKLSLAMSIISGRRKSLTITNYEFATLGFDPYKQRLITQNDILHAAENIIIECIVERERMNDEQR